MVISLFTIVLCPLFNGLLIFRWGTCSSHAGHALADVLRGAAYCCSSILLQVHGQL